VTIGSLLLVVITIYFVFAMLWSVLQRGHMKEAQDEEVGKEYHLNQERIVLMLAGFSLTALSILIGLQSKGQTQISPILVFFSVAFSSLIMSAVIVRFRIAQFFVYLSDVLLNVGLLAISCGFLVFFADTFSWTDGSTIVFMVLVVVLIVFTFAYYLSLNKILRTEKSSEKIEQR
jgi:hypothetical protein